MYLETNENYRDCSCLCSVSLVILKQISCPSNAWLSRTLASRQHVDGGCRWRPYEHLPTIPMFPTTALAFSDEGFAQVCWCFFAKNRMRSQFERALYHTPRCFSTEFSKIRRLRTKTRASKMSGNVYYPCRLDDPEMLMLVYWNSPCERVCWCTLSSWAWGSLK